MDKKIVQIAVTKASHLLSGKNLLQQDLDYANIAINGNDNKLFIDPILIYGDQNRSPLAKNCWLILEDYFQTIFTEIKNGTFTKKSHTLDHLSEQNMFRIGHSKYKENKKSRGNGCSREMLFGILDNIGFDELNDMIEKQLIKEPMDVYLYVKGLGEDRMSDLITNVLLQELTQYTEDIFLNSDSKNQLKTISSTAWGWNRKKHCWEKFNYNQLLDFSDNPLGFIPKRFLTGKYKYSPKRFFQGAVLEHLQQQYLLEHPEEKKPTKKSLIFEISKTIPGNFSKKDYIIEYTLKNPSLATTFRNTNCNGAMGTQYLGYLSDNDLTNIINKPYDIS